MKLYVVVFGIFVDYSGGVTALIENRNPLSHFSEPYIRRSKLSNMLRYR